MPSKILILFVMCVFVCESTDEKIWSDFKQKFGKFYTSQNEENLRHSIFTENMENIIEHNSRYENGQETYFLGINQFSDLSRKDFSYRNTKKIEKSMPKFYELNQDLRDDLPESFDWRDKGVVLDVRDQGDCYGASMALSVTGAVEGRNIVKHNKNIELSPQCLLDCAQLFGDFSCDAYALENAYNYIASYGIPSEEDYPYIGRIVNATCETFERADVTVKGYVDVYPREKYFKNDLVKYGPISVAISTDPLQSYSGGVFNAECYNEQNFVAGGMLLVGYGTDENGTDYWTLRNSWGTTWGEEGYVRLARNGDVGLCGIYTNAKYPTLA